MCSFTQYTIQVLSPFLMGKMTLEQRFLTWGPNIPKNPVDRLGRQSSVNLEGKNSIFIFTNCQLAFLSIMNVGYKPCNITSIYNFAIHRNHKDFQFVIVADITPKWYHCLLSCSSGILSCFLGLCNSKLFVGQYVKGCESFLLFAKVWKIALFK